MATNPPPAQSSFPGDTVTLTLLPDFPGLHAEWSAERPYFERAYAVAEAPDVIARVRFAPVAIDTGMDANVPLQTRNISVMISASMVDDTGQVILSQGRGLVRPAASFAQEVAAGTWTNAEDFILRGARIQVEDLVIFKRQMDDASLLIPPYVPAPEPSA